ncbi:uncharacterized protein METZ01_LOCUS291377 [marine metagenome]|uniref:Uncharacterized protein n=1 Tax=marine metagenome TaxID=408172 RepID=A0A382LQ70_9ZZZZ
MNQEILYKYTKHYGNNIMVFIKLMKKRIFMCLTSIRKI